MSGVAMRSTTIGLLAFSGMLQLDLTGPYAVFAAGPGAKILLVGRSAAQLFSSDGLLVTPDVAMADCPQLDVICVPGGSGILHLLEDAETLAFLHTQAQKAQYITSVCTGALVLGAAGLLKGYRATTHWSSVDLLAPLGAVYVKRRVVFDRNRVTASGVTSGIDMALALAIKLWGEEAAQTIALNMEYAPDPPVSSGRPEAAPPTVLRALREKNAARQAERAQAVLRAAARL